MKAKFPLPVLLLLVVPVLILFTAATSAAQAPACVDSSLIDPEAVCPAIYLPVCGCDGVTYGNSCEAINWGGVTSWSEGECPADTLDCPADCFFNIHYTLDGVSMHAWLLPDPVDPPLPDTIKWSLDGGPGLVQTEWTHLFDGPGEHVLCATYPRPGGGSCTVCQAVRVTALCTDSSMIDATTGCPAVYDPVCGCDGVTYGNACEAQYHHGVTSWTPGECGSVCNSLFVDFEGFNSGGSLTVWSFTPDVYFPNGEVTSWFWDFGNGQTSTQAFPSLNFMEAGAYTVCLTVGAVSANGVNCQNTVCQTIQVATVACIDPSQIDPAVLCPALYDPVCGCDDHTYPNACVAQYYAGVTSWTPGACTQGCVDTSWVDDDPLGCFEIYDPVCGCNGVTYANACVALQEHGVTSWKKGPCCTPPTDCKAAFLLEKLPGLTIRLSDVSIGAESWTLDFGDGTQHYGWYDSLMHVYPAPGVYQVCLTISNFAGDCTHTYCEPVTFGATGTQTPALRPLVAVAPNPSGGQTRVVVTGAKVRRVTVWDVFGKKWLDKSVASEAFDLDGQGLPEGLYLIVVETDRGPASRKWVVSR